MGKQINNFRGYDEYYINGSAAPNLAPVHKPKSNQTITEQPKIQKNLQNRNGASTKSFASKMNKGLVWLCTCCVCTMVVGGIIVSKFEKISSINRQISTLGDNIVMLESKIASMETQYECAVDMAYLQNVATTKYNMRYPGDSQVKEMALGIRN